MTAKDIFLITMSLMDNLSTEKNEVDEDKTSSYNNLFLNYLTMEINHIAEIRGIDLKYDIIESMTDNVTYDRYTCTNIIPYAIASKFYALNGDNDLSNLMDQKAEVAMREYKNNSEYHIHNIFS